LTGGWRGGDADVESFKLYIQTTRLQVLLRDTPSTALAGSAQAFPPVRG